MAKTPSSGKSTAKTTRPKTAASGALSQKNGSKVLASPNKGNQALLKAWRRIAERNGEGYDKR